MRTSGDDKHQGEDLELSSRHHILEFAGEILIPVSAITFASLFLLTISALPQEAQRFPVAAGIVIILLGILTIGAVARSAVRRARDGRSPDVGPRTGTDGLARRVAFWSFWVLLGIWPILVTQIGFYTSAILAILALSLIARERV